MVVLVSLTSVDCRFLAAPTVPAELSADDQIAALKAQIAAAETKVVEQKKAAGLPADFGEEKPAFQHHCTPEQKAKLDKNEPEVVAKKDDSPFADGMEATERKSLVENEEFLLGLLIMHQTRKNWSYEQELDAVCNLAGNSALVRKLYHHHKKDQSMAAQLADMMDQERKEQGPTKAPPLNVNDLIGSVMKGVVPKKK